MADNAPEDMGYTEARPSNLTKTAVYSLAEYLRSQLNFMPGGDLNPVLERLGGRLQVRDFWDLNGNESGSIYIHAEGQFDVCVSSITSGRRDRFTIAHEIGHYVLHFLYLRQQGQVVERVFARRYGNSRQEWEANWFAAAFLMPEAPFRAAFTGDISAIAQQFGVSIKAAEVRAKSLGMVDE